MSNIKETGTRPELTAGAGKENQFSKQQVEMKAGQALITETANAVSRQREKIEKERSSDREEQTEDPKDTTEISESRKRLRSDGAYPEDEGSRWQLEMEGEAWTAFLKWTPVPGADFPEQLQELSRLYMTLLEAILKYANEEDQAALIQQLDSILAQKLSLLMDRDLNQLVHLLEQTGQTTALDGIKSSIYKQTAGQSISSRAVNILFAQGKKINTGGGSNLFTAKTSGRHRTASPSPSASEEGRVYGFSKEGKIRFRQTSAAGQNGWKAQIRQRNETIANARQGISQNSLVRGASVAYTGRELARANRFASHINGMGNLLKNPQITARNDEVTGLLAAVMSIKGRVFAAEAGRSAAITLPLQNALEKIIQQYIRQKNSSRIYQHTVAAYEKMKNPQKAVREGLDYAYQQFREKQENPAYQKSAHYSRQSGFFQALLKNLSPEKEFALGLNILQKDWREFLHAIGKEQNSFHLSRAEHYSPWGAMSGAGKQKSDSDTNIGKILLAAAVILITVAAIYFLVV